MVVVELRVSNSTSRTRAFSLEPWGGKYSVESGGAVRVVIEAPTPPALEWEITDDTQTLVVHGPRGALATVLDGEKQLRAD